GATATATAQVTITGVGKSVPIANANGPYIGLTSGLVHFDGSKSYDPDGTIVNYTWDFGDGSKGYTASPTHLYPNEGEYTVTLTVKDNDALTDTVTSSVTVFLDTDGDGWSDILEEAYGTSETNPDDGPNDFDKDGIPDDDSPDGGYIGDPDDDNDGLDDDVETLLGSNPKNTDDVITLQIEGTTYYLIDTDGDGIFDTLYNPYTEESMQITIKDGKLLLDIDNDGVNEYIYDPATHELSIYTEPKQDEGFPFAFIILLIAIIIIVAIVILFKTGYLYIEDTSNKKK
ncbi:MAG: PKD domain-containing protein, partial [Candidatus Thermoplasmatota archaeon]|nr:PKD domain-containing protein [Candidatus Thermoplasmatota archaeon]